MINTGTTVVTFLMVFLIQNTQNRDSRALHTKLDELVVHMVGADNQLVVAEELSDDQLERLKSRFDSTRQRSGEQFEQPRANAIRRAKEAEANQGEILTN